MFDKQTSGNRVFDFNQEGMAHYGMLADHIQDIRERASSRVYEAVMNSAEAYLQMWERAESNRNVAYIAPLEPFVRIFNRKANRYMDIPGNDDNLVNGANVQLWSCDDEAFDQHWIFNKEKEMFENRADRTKCLDKRGQAYNNGEIVIWDCVDSDNLRWTYNMNTLASKHNSNIVADAYGYDNGDNVGQWEYRGRKWQEWELRPESAIHRWVDFRDKRKGKCRDVTGANTANGTKIQLKSCNASPEQQWYFDPVKGTLRSQLPGNKCMEVPGGQHTNVLQRMTIPDKVIIEYHFVGQDNFSPLNSFQSLVRLGFSVYLPINLKLFERFKVDIRSQGLGIKNNSAGLPGSSLVHRILSLWLYRFKHPSYFSA